MRLINKFFVIKIETVILSAIISPTFSDNNNRNSLFIAPFQPVRLIFPYSKFRIIQKYNKLTHRTLFLD